jgi:hypothetical protein
VRKYNPDGSYARTLLPFPAECKPDALPNVARWDDKRKAFMPKNQSSLNPAFYPWGTEEANIVSASPDGIVMVSGRTTYRFGPNGEMLAGPTPMWSAAAKLECPGWLIVQVTASPDGKYLYYSNVAGTKYQPKHFNDTNPAWPQGRVYRQDVSKPGSDPEKFYDLELPNWEQQKYWLPDAWNKRSAAAGVTTDAKGNLYICDLVNQEVVEVDPAGKKVSATKAPWPERIHVDAKSGSYYVICRTAQPKDGMVLKKLVKISGRGADGKIVAELPFKEGGLGEASALGVMNGQPVLWIAGGLTMICVKDAGTALEIVQTTFKPEPESQTDYNRLSVDWAREQVYVNTGTSRIWRYDGMTGQGELLKEKGKVFYGTDLTVGYDGLLYIRSGEGYSGPFERRTPALEPAPFPGTKSHLLTPYVYSRMGVGFSEHGIGVGPDGRAFFTYMYDWNKYCISGFDGQGNAMKGKYLKGKVNKPDKDGKRPMPEAIDSAVVGPLPMSNGGVRVDLKNNIYVGMRLLPDGHLVPPGFEKDAAYQHWTGCVVKYPPEGGTVLNTESKDDEPSGDAPKTSLAWAGQKMSVVGALQIYSGVGSFSGNGWGGNGSCCVCRVPRFDIDRYGRIVIPNVVTNSVTVLDNAGNELLSFGAYGNFDSQFVLPGSKETKPLVSSPAIPLAWPTGAGFSKKYLYVNDTYSRRVVRVDMKYKAETVCEIK